MSETDEIMSLVMHELLDHFKIMEETARGYRELMESQGWSPAMAEQISALLLSEMISTAFAGFKNKGQV